MSDSKATVLIVDDEEFNLEILVEHLEEAGYATDAAENGAIAWDLLQEHPDRYSAVLLDRMMPEMDGMEVLANIKRHAVLKVLPVIMQTAKAGKQDVLDGLAAGAHYYLTKPFEREHLLAIVDTAVADFQQYRQLQNELRQTAGTLCLLNEGKFAFHTLDEARNLATLLANACPDSDKVVLGLSELMINAVEHGNLGITYKDKSELNAQGAWEAEVKKRLEMDEYRDKRVVVDFTRGQSGIEILIQDEGPGFDWQDYMQMKPERAFDSHGRGIAMANTLSFDHIEYLGDGNQVRATIGS